MRPEGQVTLCCERRDRILTIDFLVVNVPDGKPALLSRRDAQPLNYLRVYADETANALEEEIPRNPQPTPPLGKLTKNDVLQCYADVFMPGRGSPLGTPCTSHWTPMSGQYTPKCAESLWRSWAE